MGQVTSTVTIDTGEWIYIDKNGSPHTVTDAESVKLVIDDTSATVVDYYFLPTNTDSLACTDGAKLYFRPMYSGGAGTTVGQAMKIGRFADAADGTAHRSVRGEIPIQCPMTGIIQYWRIANITPSNVDFDAAGTITTFRLEDQFGNVMNLPCSGEGITAAQAA